MEGILTKVKKNTHNISTYVIRRELRKCLRQPIDFRSIAVSFYLKNVIKF